MSESHWITYFKTESVSLKKYLYVLRPIFACRWIESHRSIPPVDFQQLIIGAGNEGLVAQELGQLLSSKSEMSEIGVGPRRTALDQFITNDLERLNSLRFDTHPLVDFIELDLFFRKWISR